MHKSDFVRLRTSEFSISAVELLQSATQRAFPLHFLHPSDSQGFWVMAVNGWGAEWQLSGLHMAILSQVFYQPFVNNLASKRFALAVYIVCFSIGVFTHALDFLNFGPRPYSWGPLPLEFFWSSLILLDALVIVALIFGKLRLGLSLAVTIMIADVAVNFYGLVALEIAAFAFSVPLQSLFLGFILGSIGWLWPQPITSASG